MESARDLEREEEEGLITSWIWRFSGFFEAVGGGLTMMNVFRQLVGEWDDSPLRRPFSFFAFSPCHVQLQQ